MNINIGMEKQSMIDRDMERCMRLEHAGVAICLGRDDVATKLLKPIGITRPEWVLCGCGIPEAVE